ncbi:hypothetical protein Tco_0498496, partial [Tanacetum coccineum]
GSPLHQPPPPPPLAGPSGASETSGASRLSLVTPPPPPPSMSQRHKLSVSSIHEDLHMDDDTAPDEQVQSSDDEDIGSKHIPTVNLRQ